MQDFKDKCAFRVALVCSLTTDCDREEPRDPVRNGRTLSDAANTDPFPLSTWTSVGRRISGDVGTMQEAGIVGRGKADEG